VSALWGDRLIERVVGLAAWWFCNVWADVALTVAGVWCEATTRVAHRINGAI
jgi:hypothetical protein